MTNYIQVKVKYTAQTAEGEENKVSQNILVDALSFTEAETRAVELMTPYVSVGGELTLSSMKKSPYNEVFVNVAGLDGQYWYECVVKFEHHQDNGKIRTEKQKMLVPADDIQSATDNLILAMKGTLMEYVIDGIKVTNIGEVFPYTESSILAE